jgi:hypothetical protein
MVLTASKGTHPFTSGEMLVGAAIFKASQKICEIGCTSDRALHCRMSMYVEQGG